MSEILGSRDLEVAGEALKKAFLKHLATFQDPEDAKSVDHIQCLPTKGVLNLALLLVNTEETLCLQDHQRRELWQWVHEEIPGWVEQAIQRESFGTYGTVLNYTVVIQVISYLVASAIAVVAPQLQPPLLYSVLAGSLGTIKLLEGENKRLRERNRILHREVEHYQRLVSWELET